MVRRVLFSFGTGVACPSSQRGASLVAFNLQHVLSGLVVVAVEAVLVAVACSALYAATRLLLARWLAIRGESAAAWTASTRSRARIAVIAAASLLVAGVLCFNGWLIARGLDPGAYTTAMIRSINATTWVSIGIGLGKLALAVAGLAFATRFVRRGLGSAERAINRWDRLQSNNQSLAALFVGLDRVIVNTAWLLLAVYASGWFAAPAAVTNVLLTAIRIYLVIAIGLVVIRTASVIVGTLDGLSQRSAQNQGWEHHYNHLRPLLPTFRTALEYSLWIGMGSLVLAQVDSIRHLASWGPRLIEVIGIFLAGRVVVDLGSIEIGRRMLPPEGLEEAERRRRATIVPLVRSTFTYGVYFGTAVLALGSLGFNPMPFLAGAGILGLVVGFGAQSLINDVVSGFFILFEDTYLVGDTIETGPAKGIVEGIEFRTTRIRDSDGRLHILRHGDIKEVINYSKEYSIAVVAVEMPYDADLRSVFATLSAAGEQVRAENPDVLQPTQIDGITDFGGTAMTVRTSTRAMPGRHEAVAAALRLAIKEAFDVHAMRTPRKGLVA